MSIDTLSSKRNNDFLSFWFGRIDTRPFSLFRIFFAAHLIKVAIFYLPLTQLFFSDSGLYPRDIVLANLVREQRFSLMDAFSTDWMATLFLLFWIVVLVGMMLGYRTRLMVILNFVCILSVQERNIYLLNGADVVARVLSFWCMFIPLADYYSFDAIRRRWQRYRQTKRLDDLRVSETPITTYAFPVRMIQIQFALIYIFTGIIKTKSPTWWDGGAIYYALQLQTLTLPTADWFLANMPEWVFRLMSRVTLIGELGFAAFVFTPIFQPWLRIIGIGVMAMIHIGIMFLMTIADFSMVMLIGYLLFFLPGWVLWLDRLLRVKRDPLVVRSPVGDDDPRWALLSVTRDAEITVADQLDHTNLDERGEFVAMLARLPLSRLWLWTLRFNRVYRLAYGLSQRFACQLTTSPATVRPSIAPANSRWILLRRAVLTGGLALMMVGVLWVNVLTVSAGNRVVSQDVPPVLRAPVYYAGMWQQWNMFAPYPIAHEGYIIVPGQFEDGTTFDLKTGQPVVDEMRRWTWGPDGRWRKFDDAVADHAWTDILRNWGGTYCRYYNDEQALPEGKRLATVDIIYRYHEFYRPGTARSPLQDRQLWHHWCLPEYADGQAQ